MKSNFARNISTPKVVSCKLGLLGITNDQSYYTGLDGLQVVGTGQPEKPHGVPKTW